MEDCEETCWICLEGTDANGACCITNRLIKPCRCPRQVHPVCLAKWQLSNAGRSEERSCRFCMTQLPDWQEHLSLPGMATVEPVMSVHFRGRTYMIKVKPGEEGRLAFIRDVRRMLKLKPEQEFNITFECKVPGHGMVLDLKGLSSYDAAVFCAAMTAVERQRVAAEKAQKKEAARIRSSNRRVMPARASTDVTSTSTSSSRSTTSTSRLSDVTAPAPAGLRTSSDGAVTPLAAAAPPPPRMDPTARPLSMDGATSSSDIVPEALDSTSDVGLHPTSSGEAHHHPHLPSSPGVRASARAQSHFRADSHGICELEGGEGEQEGAGDEASERRSKSLHGQQQRQQEEVRQGEEQQEQEQLQTHVPWIRRLAQSLLCIGH